MRAALYDPLRGLGALVGELVPFFVALSIILAVDACLTLLLAFAPDLALFAGMSTRIARVASGRVP